MNWKTKSGEKIEIKKMTDNHLLNTIKFIERNTESYVNSTQNFYLNCVPPNGEWANELFDIEFDKVMEMNTEELLAENNKYKAMLKEVKRRKLILPN